MATRRRSIIGHLAPDTSGDCYEAPLAVAASFGTASLEGSPSYVMKGNLATDCGLSGTFPIPDDYVGSPVIVIRGIPAGRSGSGNLGFGMTHSDGIAHDESFDVAHNSEVTAAAAEPSAALDMYEETLAMNPSGAFSPNDDCNLAVYREAGGDAQTYDFLCTDVLFQYADA